MLKREECKLRPIISDDLEKILSWRNSERIRVNMYSDHSISLSEHTAWFERLQLQETSKFLLFEAVERPAGLVYFTDIDAENNRSHWGFYLGEENLPRGYGSALGTMGLEYAFNNLNIRKLCGEAFAFNDASIRFHEKFGFAVEGRFVKHVLKRGVYEDVISFALFRESWITKQQELSDTAFARESRQ